MAHEVDQEHRFTSRVNNATHRAVGNVQPEHYFRRLKRRKSMDLESQRAKISGGKKTGGSEIKVYYISIDMAKELYKGVSYCDYPYFRWR